jgi:hypothetical protein
MYIMSDLNLFILKLKKNNELKNLKIYGIIFTSYYNSYP